MEDQNFMSTMKKHGFISHMKIFSACTKIVINFGVSSVLCCFIRDVLYEYIYKSTKMCSHAQKLKHHAIYIYIEIFGPLYSFIFNNIVKDRYIKKITEETCPDIGSERKIKTPKQSTVDVLDVVKCNVGGGGNGCA